MGLGQQPSNLVAITDRTLMLVAPLSNVYYRVVAIDAAGTWGGASPYVELPRPCVYSCVNLEAKVGSHYSAELVPSLSIGDYQYVDPAKGASPPFEHGDIAGFFEREGSNFSFVGKSHPWLKLSEPASGQTAGILSGVPTAADVGSTLVQVRTQMTYINGYNTPGSPWWKGQPQYAKT
jgi:hypothetical protein